MAKFSNPLAFTPLPVTIITTALYAVLLIALIVVHVTVPTAPYDDNPIPGIIQWEAWRDLQMITRGYHQYNTRNNDNVRDYLIQRIDSIIRSHGRNTTAWEDQPGKPTSTRYTSEGDDPAVYVFNDNTSNLTFSIPSSPISDGVSTYFEGTNIIVYIQGSDDDRREWWNEDNGEPHSKGGVLVNAHYDSVSAGYGATDDGVGVVTILQLISHYSLRGNTPKKGLVALLNNGEEDFLNGARVFSQHPMSKFPHTFLNLEGAAAGGRAQLFRTTDVEVTQAYKRSPYPYGSVISADGFEAGLVRSQTDYVVFNGDLGYRGLDVAFTKSRARYHTDQDDTQHTSRNSIWHMLSAALETTKSLTSYTGNEFEEKGDEGKVGSGRGSRGVWFDLFGRAFAVFKAHTIFAISVTLVVVSPLILMLTLLILYKCDKLYAFSGARLYHHPEGDEEILLLGWRGFFRFPVIFAIASAVPILLALLISKYNELIVHSSDWSVWAMMLSSWIFFAWFFSRSADFARPSVLTRFYTYFWIMIVTWALLVVDIIFQEHFHLAGGYFALFYFAGFFLATWVSYLELFTLTRKSKYCHERMDPSRRDSVSASQLLSPEADENTSQTRGEQHEEDDDEANESTGLLSRHRRKTFANYTRNDDSSPITEDHEGEIVGSKGKWFGAEQEWSGDMPRWTWLLQLLFSAPMAIILIGQIGFLLTQGLHQTGADGGSIFIVYLFIAIISILLLTPLLPYLHRFTWHVPIFMLLVFIGTLIYNLVAFPVSPQNRLKFGFQQVVDLDKGNNTVTLVGLKPYLGKVLYSLPSADGFGVPIISGPYSTSSHDNRWMCEWPGLAPNVVHNKTSLHERGKYSSWLTYDLNRTSSNSAIVKLSGRNTRACRLEFDKPVFRINVRGSGPQDERYLKVPSVGSKTLNLWSRTWENSWTLDVEWRKQNGRGLSGRAVCKWNDDNYNGVIPALDEARHFAPNWAAFTGLRAGAGLVEGYKRFSI
ncbi:MAG: hypothetical protein Q9227_004091 [Pyrenula ochraceoflavens]